jgi:hypothetical protein
MAASVALVAALIQLIVIVIELAESEVYEIVAPPEAVKLQ